MGKHAPREGAAARGAKAGLYRPDWPGPCHIHHTGRYGATTHTG